MFSPSSRGRLTDRDLGRFPGHTLFHRVARAVCHAGCLPRKELYEAWEMARRVRRLFRGGRVVDLGAGHGLLAQVMLLLDDSSPKALVVDPAPPKSTTALHEALVATWPRLRDRVTVVTAAIEDLPLETSDVVVSSHACGALSDRVLDRAVAVRARLAVLPGEDGAPGQVGQPGSGAGQAGPPPDLDPRHQDRSHRPCRVRAERTEARRRCEARCTGSMTQTRSTLLAQQVARAATCAI